jgi:hypothetical protein
MLKEILFLQQFLGARGGAFAFRESAPLFISRTLHECAPVPICDFKLFQTHARCDFNESSLDSRFSLLALTQHLSLLVILQSGSYSSASCPLEKETPLPAHSARFRGDWILQMILPRYGKREIQQNDLFGVLEVKVLPFLSCASNFFNYTDGNRMHARIP